MKRLLVLLFLLGSIIPMTGQTIVELRKGATTVRSKNLHDYDVQTKDTRQEREDSLKYADNLKWAYNYLHSDSLAAAERLFRECLQLRPKAPGNNILRRSLGQIALAQGRYREAIETFTEVLRLNPSDHGARMDRATVYLQDNNPQACITDCDLLMPVAQTDSLRERLYFLRGAAHLQNRQYSNARNDLEKVLSFNPSNTNAPILLAMTLEKEGRPKEALQRISIYINAHPQDLNALLYRIHLEEEQQNFPALRNDYDQALHLAPDNRELYVGRAGVLIQQKDFGAARRDLDKAVSLGMPRAALRELYKQLQ